MTTPKISTHRLVGVAVPAVRSGLNDAGMEVWAAVVLAVSGAAVTCWAVRRTQQLADESERRRMRRDVLRKLVGARHTIVEGAQLDRGEFWMP